MEIYMFYLVHFVKISLFMIFIYGDLFIKKIKRRVSLTTLYCFLGGTFVWGGTFIDFWPCSRGTVIWGGKSIETE